MSQRFAYRSAIVLYSLSSLVCYNRYYFVLIFLINIHFNILIRFYNYGIEISYSLPGSKKHTSFVIKEDLIRLRPTTNATIWTAYGERLRHFLLLLWLRLPVSIFSGWYDDNRTFCFIIAPSRREHPVQTSSGITPGGGQSI